MDIEMKQVRNTLIVKLKGELDMQVADKLRKELDKKLENEKIENLIINLGKVTFIDSSGLGVIIGRYKKVSSRKGKMYIVGANPSVEKILVFCGINKLVPIYGSEQDIINI
ncbi:Anti-sigma F factor antagonist [Syntrophomonas zehnderi OL-4]|uniref:Anti-sigma F factor antagonist n=1 Tax=Syntrophomonas zehnderi OL-4 TaxID=690567 RepID=A0A0E4GAI2_9FIRM|nr:anti-sigma F factor antagonist [Syntrophomonas zehnderi]CFX51424.1 Anti-sigma F factor antagonist [Syntrophomonas zehnderi OL-4]